MTEHNVSTLRVASELRVRDRKAWQRAFTLALLMLGFASNACLSDLDIPECALRGNCGHSGASGSASSGDAAGASEAGEAGETNMGGSAGGLAGGEVASPGGEGGIAGIGGSGANGGTASGGTGGAGFSGGGIGGSALAGGNGGVSGAGVDGGGPSGGADPLGIVTTAVPAPCGTDAYSSNLKVYGGIAPYHWQVSPAVEGWSAKADPQQPDGSVALLASARPGAAAITVVVTDDSGQSASATFDTSPRTSCWFAYTAWTAANGATLTVVDPLLGHSPPTTLAYNHDVYDFAFSPDGKYLSYRFGANLEHEHGTTLVVVNLVTWAEQQLNFSDETSSSSDFVTAYAWSADSSTLAASFVHNGSPYLGGVRFAVDGKLSKLIPRKTIVDSALYWVGNVVAYYVKGYVDGTVNPPQLIPYDGIVTGYYSELGTVGFADATLSTEIPYQLPVFVQTTNDGFYIKSPSFPQLQFNWVHAGGPSAVDDNGRLVSPSGHVTADASSGSLKFYRAEHPEEIATNATDRDCPKLLTWAKGKERIACVRDIPANEQHRKYGELRIFDLADDDSLSVEPLQGSCQNHGSPPPASGACAPLTYDYSSADSTEQPRLLSDSGDWLAVSANPTESNGTILYLADLRTKPFNLKWRHEFVPIASSGIPTVKLAFSPDERWLLQLLGKNVFAHAVLEDGRTVLLPDFDLNAPDGDPTCSDDFVAHPDRWCGSADRPPPFKWDRRSRSVAYRSRNYADDETIVVVDFTPAPGIAQNYFAAPSCSANCAGQFEFQP